MRVHQHTGSVVTMPGWVGYFASCDRCGSDKFPDRLTREQAQADLDRHIASTGAEVRAEGERA